MGPNVGRVLLRIAQRRQIGVTIIIVLALAAGVAWRAGALTPRLESGDGSEYGADRGTIHYGISVRNTGYLPLTIIGAGRSGAGLELASVDGQLPVTLRHGEQTWIKLRYRVTDCGAVTSNPWPIPVTVERLWGAQTVHLAIPTQLLSEWQGSDLPSLSVARTGPIEWQRIQADVACALLTEGPRR